MTQLEPIQKPGRSRQDYATPFEFVAAVAKRFGPLVCDLAASSDNTKAPDFFTEAHDSLKQSWRERHPTGTLWLNPPFGDIGPWAKKCADESEGRAGLLCLLTPASIGSNWFCDHVLREAMVFGLSPRITFEGAPDPYPKDLMLSVFGFGLWGFDVWRWK